MSITDIEKLRQELRNGRANETGGNSSEDGGNSNEAVRSASEKSRGRGRTISGNASALGSDKRGTQDESERVRQGRRRSVNDGSGTANRSSEATGSTGFLERQDAIPERLEDIPTKRPVGRPPKPVEAIAKAKKQFFSAGKTLTKEEAENYFKPLAKAMQDYGEYADKYIRHKTVQSEEDMPEIWGDLTDFEAEILAKILIRRGQKSGHAADIVRGLVNGTDYINAAIIVVPRVIRTAEEMKKVPPKPRKQKKS